MVIDLRNAYNEVARRAIIETFSEEETLRHMAQFCAITLAPVHGLESGGTCWGESAEGDTQGDPAASMRFCVALQPSLRRLDAACNTGGCGGMARAGADDVAAIGPAHIVLPAVEEFAREVQERCLLIWERTKSKVFTWNGELPEGTPTGLTLAGDEIDGAFEPGFLLYGVPIGSDKYCTYQLNKIAKRIVSDAQQTVQLLSTERQALWSSLRSSIAQRFDYWLQLCYPSVVKPVAAWLDSEIWKVLESATGLTIPRGPTDDHWSCVLPVPVVGREGRSFQEWVVRQPVRFGGFGLQSLEDTANIAFIGALEQAIPAFTKICPQLSNVFGGEDFFGPEADPEVRWRAMLESGCREGTELKSVWSLLQQEAHQAADWLGEERQEHFSQNVEGVGGSSTDGSTRGRLSEERDATRSKCITKGLDSHTRQDRTNRPVWSWLQRDKLSSAWLQALPGPDSSLTSAEFSEAAAAALCLPSPACMERLGQTVRGRQVVDLYGENVLCASLPGDHFRKRHDSYKMRIFQMSQWAGLDAEVEVFNLFSALIPQEGLSRIEKARKLQSIVPDLRITIPVEGNPTPSLHEVKIISSSKTRYTPHRQGQEATRAVDKRSSELQGEYVQKAKKTDESYCGTPEGTIGPVERKLASLGEVKGIVVGAFGEASQSLHDLIHHLADSRVKMIGPQLGKKGQYRSEKAEIAIVTSFIRRTLSVCGVKGQAWTIINRLDSLGPGSTMAVRRRNAALQLERRWSLLRRAHALSVQQGKTVLRRGHFKVN